MLRQNRAPVEPLFVLAAAALMLGGACGEEFSDEAFGVLDLSSVYGGTALDPVGKLPTQIDPQAGYVDGQRGEFYDFGKVAAIVDPLTLVPSGVRPQPMYFFYRKKSGVPLAASPVREARDGTDWMLGGKAVRNPNPRELCGSFAEQGVPCPPEIAAQDAYERSKPYPVRARDLLVDPLRGSADYQRPIVDVNPADISVRWPQYTGVWEVVEVLVPDDYEVDSIKHAETLARAIDAGKVEKRHTGKVINCPILDERTYVPRGVTDRNTPRPRIELWYRRQRTFCFLADGWETLGNADRQLWFAGDDDLRVQTFDVHRTVLGRNGDAVALVVPVSPLYMPAVFTFDPVNNGVLVARMPDSVIAVGMPRKRASDPTGYTPLRWVFDLPVENTAERPFQPGRLRSIGDVDRTAAIPQPGSYDQSDPGSREVVIKNMPFRGVAVKCSWPEVTTKPGPTLNSYYCGRLAPNPEDPEGAEIIDARGDTRCNEIGLECNKNTCYCDAPFVGYGKACGPGIAQCNPDKDAFSESGYTCFPPSNGFCHIRCLGANARSAENKDKKPTEWVDTRCKELPGYYCFGYIDGGICLKSCDQNVTAEDQCTAGLTGGFEGTDIGAGQTCQDWGLEICTWPDTFQGRE